MKKQIISFALAVGLAGSAHATGTIFGELNFETFDVGNLGLHQILAVDGMKATGPNHVARVYIGSTSDFGSMTAIGNGSAELLGGSGAGFIDANQANAGLLSTTGFNSGEQVFYSIAAWDTTTGATFDSALHRGNSDPVQITIGGRLANGDPGPPAPALNTFATFQLEVVPEPSTVALGIIGGLALLLRRRK